MKKINIIFYFLLCLALYFHNAEAYFGRDWAIWEKAKTLIKTELDTQRSVGLAKEQFLKGFDLFTHGLGITVDTNYLASPAKLTEDFNLINGKGILLKPNSKDGAVVEIKMPLRKLNTCGFIIKSTGSSSSPVKIRLYWKRLQSDEFEILTRPDTGKLDYKLNLNTVSYQTALFFDIVPAQFFKITVKSNNTVNFTIASINKCIFNRRHILTDCGEKVIDNVKFMNVPHGQPISIRCPTDCIRTWPCWGYNIYSSDSPICWTAVQFFGRWGNGEYTLYKIKNVYYFRQVTNLTAGHNVFCRGSTTKFSAYAFERKYYDFAIKEDIKIKKALGK